MPLAPLQRNYNMPDADLCMFTSNLVGFMTRDITEFGNYGIDAADVTALETLGNAFEVFPSDEIYLADVGIATEDKDAALETLKLSMKNVTNRALNKWGDKSPRYKKFGVIGIGKFNDREMLFAARRVHLVGTEYLLQLADQGLTAAMLTTLQSDSQAFEDTLNELKDKQAERDIKAEERITKGNELYLIVAKYCEIGKQIWENVSEAKYNDYVIYKTVEHGLSKPQNLLAEYDPLNPPNITLSWDAVLEATNYDVYYNIANIGSPSGDYQLLNNYASSPASIPAILAKRNYFKIKAKNDTETSSYSDEVFVDVVV
jgi:hypothetical protein